tara:strand:- start:258 stop:782 length:525 start_codon:yes stop_codon:yes gene_type:complete
MFSSDNDPIRKKTVIMIDKYIKNLIKSKIIEKSVYNYIIDISKKKNINRYWSNVIFKNLYLSKIRSLYVNINKDSYIKNENFLKRILSNDIDIKTISYLEIYDIYPENWKYLIELRTKQDKLKYEIKPEAMTTLFKCRKCGSRSTSYYEVQTRAADEPMTQFITCLDCNTRWKQ